MHPFARLDTVHGQRGTDACISLLEEVHCCRPDLQKWFARPCPLSGSHREITAIFYRRMFSAHPELERNLFNRGNQAQGDQQRALAGSIAAYATLLLSETAPDSSDLLAVSRTSTLPRHLRRPVPHRARAPLRGDRRVLGDAVTEEVAAAWDEVYWHMANTLISMERSCTPTRGCAGRGVAAARRTSQDAGVPRHGVVRARIAGRRELPLARPDSTSPSRSHCRTVPARSGSTASPAPPSRRSGASP